jgi:hypothetical protein
VGEKLDTVPGERCTVKQSVQLIPRNSDVKVMI